MQKKDLVSIIVPVYNVEKYVSRCVESLLVQKYNNIEILLVDDGSTDKTGKICDKYAELDHRVRVFHKKNGGLSDARNYALDRIKGKYVTFVDGDDFVTEDYIEVLLNLIIDTSSEISICINNLIYDDDSIKHVYRNFNGRKIITKNSFKMLEIMLYQKKFDTNACIKMYKSSLFDDIRFPVGKLYEDLDTIYKVFLKAKNITYINKEMYFYFQRSTSIVGKPFSQEDMYAVEAINKMLKCLKQIDYKEKLNGKLKRACISKLLSVNFYILRRTKLDEKYAKYNDICIKNIKKYKNFNLKSRIKNNIAIILFLINPKLICYF